VYRVSKFTTQRGADILEEYGPERISVNSASDAGESSPSSLIDTALEFRRRGHSEAEVGRIFYSNPCLFFGQCAKWKLKAVGQ
jgi:predicted metal-dependent TIM-barrel fold hydrolase